MALMYLPAPEARPPQMQRACCPDVPAACRRNSPSYQRAPACCARRSSCAAAAAPVRCGAASREGRRVLRSPMLHTCRSSRRTSSQPRSAADVVSPLSRPSPQGLLSTRRVPGVRWAAEAERRCIWQSVSCAAWKGRKSAAAAATETVTDEASDSRLSRCTMSHARASASPFALLLPDVMMMDAA